MRINGEKPDQTNNWNFYGRHLFLVASEGVSILKRAFETGGLPGTV